MTYSRSVLTALTLLWVLPTWHSVPNAHAWSLDQIPADNAMAVLETGSESAPGGLPDGGVDRVEAGDIRAAWYVGPTDRYRHGILGDAIEASGLTIRTADGAEITMRLPETEVFEDRTPRLIDLDRDGRMEVVTIRASLQAGASVTIYSLRGGVLRQLASTPFIGIPNRWLNIAGIADFAGLGTRQIAYVETPHIGGTLVFYAYLDGELRRLASMGGFSNHAIGAREMGLSATADLDGDGLPDLLLPTDSRRTLKVVGFQKRTLSEQASIDLPAPLETDIATRDTPRGLSFVFGLADGRFYQLTPP